MYMLVECSSGDVLINGASVSDIVDRSAHLSSFDKGKVVKAIHKQLSPNSKHKTILGGKYRVIKFETGKKRENSLLASDLKRLIDLERFIFEDKSMDCEIVISSYLSSKGVTPVFAVASSKYIHDIKKRDKSGDYDFIHRDYRRFYLGSRSYFSERVDSGSVYIEIKRIFVDSTNHVVSVLKSDVLDNCNAYSLFIDINDDTLYIQSLKSSKSGEDEKGKEVYLENVSSDYFGGRVYSLEDSTLRLTIESERHKELISRQNKKISNHSEEIELLSDRVKNLESEVYSLKKENKDIRMSMREMEREHEAFKELFKKIVNDMPKDEADKLREEYKVILEEKKKLF